MPDKGLNVRFLVLILGKPHFCISKQVLHLVLHGPLYVLAQRHLPRLSLQPPIL